MDKLVVENGILNIGSVGFLSRSELSCWLMERLHGRDEHVPTDVQHGELPHALFLAIYPRLERSVRQDLENVVLEYVRELARDSHTSWKGDPADELLLLAQGICDSRAIDYLVEIADKTRLAVSRKQDDNANLHYRALQCLLGLNWRGTVDFWESEATVAPERCLGLALGGLALINPEYSVALLTKVGWSEAIRTQVSISLMDMLEDFSTQTILPLLEKYSSQISNPNIRDVIVQTLSEANISPNAFIEATYRKGNAGVRNDTVSTAIIAEQEKIVYDMVPYTRSRENDAVIKHETDAEGVIFTRGSWARAFPNPHTVYRNTATTRVPTRAELEELIRMQNAAAPMKSNPLPLAMSMRLRAEHTLNELNYAISIADHEYAFASERKSEELFTLQKDLERALKFRREDTTTYTNLMSSYHADIAAEGIVCDPTPPAILEALYQLHDFDANALNDVEKQLAVLANTTNAPTKSMNSTLQRSAQPLVLSAFSLASNAAFVPGIVSAISISWTLGYYSTIRHSPYSFLSIVSFLIGYGLFYVLFKLTENISLETSKQRYSQPLHTSVIIPSSLLVIFLLAISSMEGFSLHDIAESESFLKLRPTIPYIWYQAFLVAFNGVFLAGRWFAVRHHFSQASASLDTDEGEAELRRNLNLMREKMLANKMDAHKHLKESAKLQSSISIANEIVRLRQRMEETSHKVAILEDRIHSLEAAETINAESEYRIGELEKKLNFELDMLWNCFSQSDLQ